MFFAKLEDRWLNLMLSSSHLLIVSPSGRFRGGADGSLLHLLRRHEQFPLPLTVVFLESGDLVEAARSTGVSCHLIEAGRLRHLHRLCASVQSLAAIIAELKPTTVLSWQAKAHIYAGLAAARSGTRPKLLYFQKNAPDRRLLSQIVRRVPASGALACSDFVAATERKWVRFPVLTVSSTSEFIDFDEETRDRLAKTAAGLRAGLPGQSTPGRPVIGIVARLQRWKGVADFVEALAELRRAGLPTTGLIVGGKDSQEPEFEGELRQLIRDLGMEENTVMTGNQSEVAPWILACDVIVHASDREPFGQVILEAMALGVPVIACKPGGPEEIITHEHDGLLFRHGDHAGLSAAITRFLTDSSLANSCRSRARISVQRFAPEKFLQRLAEAIAFFETSDPPHPSVGDHPVSSDKAA
jgi:glycosyltransferase involved in cell wall biosynthesis